MSVSSLGISHTLRRLRTDWAVASASIAMLGLGICATTTMFAVVDTVAVRSLPFPDSTQLVVLSGTDGSRKGMRVPKPIVEALARSRDFSGIAVHSPIRGTLKTANGAWGLVGERISSNYFQVFGVLPSQGRGLIASDDLDGAAPVAVISNEMWRIHFGARKEILESLLSVDGVDFSIVGVMPQDFRTTFAGSATDFWTTRVSPEMRQFEAKRGYEVLARLDRDATLASALSNSAQIVAGLGSDGWETGKRRLAITSLQDEVVGESANGFKLLLIAAAAVLAVACANVAVLLLTQSERRSREFGLRRALGAGTANLLIEAASAGAVIATAAGALGVAGSHILLRLVKFLAPSTVPRLTEAAIDGRVLAFAIVIVAITSLAVTVVPAIRLSKFSPTVLLSRSPATGKTRQPATYFMGLGIQIAISLTLAVFAALAVRLFIRIYPFDLGFESANRYVFRLVIPPATYPDGSDRMRRIEDLTRDLRSAHGIELVSAGSNVPFSGNTLEGKVSLPAGAQSVELPEVDFQWIFPDFMEVFGIRLVEGVPLKAEDADSAVVDERFVDAVGNRQMILGSRALIGEKRTAVTIVGIARAVRAVNRATPLMPVIYLPANSQRLDVVYLTLNARLGQAELTQEVWKAVRRSLPDVPLRGEEALSMAGLVARTAKPQRLMAATLTALAACAITLCLAGIAAIVTYTIANRQRELAIRLALGARPRTILGLLLGRIVVTLCAALAVAAVAVTYLTTFVQSQVGAVGTPTGGFVALVFCAVATSTLLVAILPAYRASRPIMAAALGSDRV